MAKTSQAKEAAQASPKNVSAQRRPLAAKPASESANPQSLQASVTNQQSASPQEILQLQRSYGNRAVQRLVQRAGAKAPIGREGGAVDNNLQSQIDSARTGGQPLDKSTGAQIGGALGADFSGVRVHTGPAAHGLNRSLSAQAFTTGSDIFFSQGAYSPGTQTGQQLLAHELTHVVQQGGSKANKVQTKLTVGPVGDKFEQEADTVAASIGRGQPSALNPGGAQAGPALALKPLKISRMPDATIRRKVGFEFEVMEWNTHQSRFFSKFTTAQQPANTDARKPVPKGKALLKGAGFELQADELQGGDSDMEFVVHPPLDEDDVAGLTTVTDDIEDMADELVAQAPNAGDIVTARQISQAGHGQVGLSDGMFENNGVIDAKPQTTVGLRLEQIVNFMKDVGLALPAEGAPETGARRQGRQELTGNLQPDQVSNNANLNRLNVMARADDHATAALTSYRLNNALAPAAPDDKLKGLLAMVMSYLSQGHLGTRQYAKTIGMLMSRTDFAQMFRMIEPAQKVYYEQGNGQRFADLVHEIPIFNAFTWTDPVFHGGVYTEDPNADHQMLAALTRDQWLRKIAKGKDLLTKRNFPTRNRRSEMESLGHLGRKTEAVGNDNEQSPIFELRSLPQHVPLAQWQPLALNIQRYLKRLNRHKNQNNKKFGQ
jgi:Domain of unknown function (DUF4157)